MPAPPLTPAHPAVNADGVPWSDAYNDIYHSSDGALEQARHVFIGGNGLPTHWQGRDRFTIVETGFGLGLNFLATCDALHEGRGGPAHLHYVSVEKHPFAHDDLATMLSRWPQLASHAQDLLAAWPLLLPGFHRLHLARGRVTLTLLFGDAADLLAQLDARADAIYLDGFAPDRNPDMWSPAVINELARIAAPGATLATWTVAGSVRSALADAGFAVERRPGFARKREMLGGRRTGDAVPAPAPPRRVAIVGAGLAGTFCADRFAARGCEVTLIERHAAPAREASGNPAGLVRPILNREDGANAQLSRAALGYAMRHFAALDAPAASNVSGASGVLQLARDAREAERFGAIVDAQQWPGEYLRFVDAKEAARLAGRSVRGAGWWMPSSGWASAPALCAANVDRLESRARRAFSADALSLARGAGGWRVEGRAGLIADADIVVLATAADAHALAPDAALPVSAVRGQVSLLPAGQRLDVPVCGDGIVAPMPGGGYCLGATFQRNDDERMPRIADHAANLARAESLLPGFTAGIDPGSLNGRASFRATTPDRLPIYGELLQQPGVHVAVGLGARGLLWAPLGAELLASQVCGDPLPLPRGLAAALSTARFTRR